MDKELFTIVEGFQSPIKRFVKYKCTSPILFDLGHHPDEQDAPDHSLVNLTTASGIFVI